MNPIVIRNVEIGKGIPKVCVSIVGKTLEDIKEEARDLMDCDIIEWRADFFDRIENSAEIFEVLIEIRKILSDKPIIFTFRGYNLELYKYVISTGIVDIIDIDLQNGENEIVDIVEKARSKNIAVIVSSHNFKSTCTKQEIIEKMEKSQELGDISKMAVTPNSIKDVVVLLDVASTIKEYFKKPFIAISMSSLGVISRLAAEDFGSAIVFASGKKASASGQINISDTKKILTIIHTNK